MLFLDTDTCIEFMRGNLAHAREILEATNPSLIKIPAIVEAELKTGVRKSAHPRKNLHIVENFLAPFEVVPFDGRCACEYARIRAELENKGEKIGPNDLIIAATACAHHGTLVTNNVKHFSRVYGLDIESWDVVSV